jgi:hypothetical protein
LCARNVGRNLHPEPGILKIERISAKARHSSGPFLLSAHFARAKEDNELLKKMGIKIAEFGNGWPER